MSRKPVFWILFTLVSVLSLTFAIRNFPRAFPIVSIDLRMDRAAALAAARDLATRHGFGPVSGAREAARFAADDSAKTFLELEGGGADVFRRMIDEGVYEAYTWQVRRFRPGETRETLIRFTPSGTPYGFKEKLPEDEPGAALGDTAALAIAGRTASAWHLDLGDFRIVERSSEARPGGRHDHTFVYERPGVAYGDAHVRLRIVVSGDRATELTHFLRVPESFDRRYEKMRAANDAIALGATGAMALLYLLGACVVGLLLLARRGLVHWRPAMVWGIVIAGGAVLASVNEWPLAWMGYDTALPPGTFFGRTLMQWVLIFLADAGMVALSFAAAESLGRAAFPEHPQLWRLWSRDAASSKQVLGRTAGGVLLTGIEFGYVIGFYLLASTVWKWWTPAEALINPDLLATWLPWLSAVAPSAHAGFWEETLFRAVPLASGALIGQRFGRRGLGIAIAMVVQALIFGGAHASYPSQPAWSRPVELIVPSLIWGFAYLRFGLLPIILTHYLFDLALFALPIFTSTAASSRMDQAMVIVAGLVPVAIVAWARWRAGRFSELPESLRNRGFVPDVAEEDIPEAPRMPVAGALSAARVRALLALGVVGLVAWVIAGGFKANAPPLALRRDAALRTGTEALRRHGFDGAAQWQVMATVDDDDVEASVYAWRELGPAAYGAMLGREIAPPHWRIRAARFTRDVVANAEEWHAHLAPGGEVRVRHTLPQDSARASLDEAAARALALATVSERLPGAGGLREVSLAQAKQKNRVDWTYTATDTTRQHAAAGSRGERRVRVDIAGDQVLDARRFLFVPEQWQREQRAQAASLSILRTVRTIVVAIVAMIAASLAITAWVQRRFPLAHAGRFFVVMAVAGLASIFNQWPVLVSAFSTAQPLELQRTILVFVLAIGQPLFAAFLALLAGLARLDLAPAAAGPPPRPLHGIALGLLAAGGLRALLHLGGIGSPLEGNAGPAATQLPLLAEALSPVTSLLIRGSVLMAVVLIAQRITAGWTSRRAQGALFLILAGGLAAAPGSAHVPVMWIAQALAAGAGMLALHVLFLRHDLRVLPWMMATLSLLVGVRTIALAAHPDAILGAALGMALTCVVAWWWTRELSRA